ncbi:acetyl-CoA carboxylase biotin carboxylase subunit [Pseudonocardia eucalypti]|uniref:biotin carboxylase n=1 Tax=Pseudonocardia eucalypti TaxID=648755 RepID=A0ABP9PGR1_9PSEU|nr:acetyl-CoA carboxylase biotin carboxylase subunit [Pseudonocardia eucalypti]
MISRVLVANRGEIAVRVIRACRDLGLTAVAVYSEADADALHVSLADEAVPIGPAPARSSYLDVSQVVGAARDTNCDAVHPGYGFLAENPALPRACQAAGLVFVGPPAEVIERVGDKVSARAAAEAAHVPVVPGSGRLASAGAALEYATEVGFPVLLKAAAGGGGRGIRRVGSAEELPAEFTSAAREAESAFGDGGLFVEKCIVDARHVEIQVLADAHGSVVHLGERECSLQRRRQKLVEEAPAPGLPEALRKEIGAAAVRLAREVGYRGAGTVEFLVDPSTWAYYFIEVNARIQVEHGITELVTGVDLVATQLRIADGSPLPFAQDEVVARGVAMEFRINAEDPARGFFPSPGTLSLMRPPAGPGVRVDTGFESGRVVPPFYDSLLAKLMVWAPDRPAALARARRALAELRVEGVATTAALHGRILDWPDFVAGRYHTGSLEAFLNG